MAKPQKSARSQRPRGDAAMWVSGAAQHYAVNDYGASANSVTGT